ncbi:hypothetical protein ZYGR_0AF04850 [Zygosaccharomyces rouxii]|uniref:Uncharacterized protein n=1 Tax=Zygosaccharomyces rouxii TaxID=4956 RepID=A0A1Q3A8W0_ZYGRO|nr:hypothetical protein ZYGR_0AF04850 [Zygosaccharomyces rouxii]
MIACTGCIHSGKPTQNFYIFKIDLRSSSDYDYSLRRSQLHRGPNTPYIVHVGGWGYCRWNNDKEIIDCQHHHGPALLGLDKILNENNATNLTLSGPPFSRLQKHSAAYRGFGKTSAAFLVIAVVISLINFIVATPCSFKTSTVKISVGIIFCSITFFCLLLESVFCSVTAIYIKEILDSNDWGIHVETGKDTLTIIWLSVLFCFILLIMWLLQLRKIRHFQLSKSAANEMSIHELNNFSADTTSQFSEQLPKYEEIENQQLLKDTKLAV